MLNIPKSMYGKGPKDNPAPSKSYDTSGSRAYGDAQIRMLAPTQELAAKNQFRVDLIKIK